MEILGLEILFFGNNALPNPMKPKKSNLLPEKNKSTFRLSIGVNWGQPGSIGVSQGQSGSIVVNWGQSASILVKWGTPS